MCNRSRQAAPDDVPYRTIMAVGSDGRGARRGALVEYVLKERRAPSAKILGDRSISAIMSSIRRAVHNLSTERRHTFEIGEDSASHLTRELHRSIITTDRCLRNSVE